MDITKDAADVAAEFGMSKYVSVVERDAALLQEIARLRTELADLRQQEPVAKARWTGCALEVIGLTQHGAAFALKAAHSPPPTFKLYAEPVPDDTALRQAVIRAQEEMRERCIEEVRGVGGIDAIEVERCIRALEVNP